MGCSHDPFPETDIQREEGIRFPPYGAAEKVMENCACRYGSEEGDEEGEFVQVLYNDVEFFPIQHRKGRRQCTEIEIEFPADSDDTHALHHLFARSAGEMVTHQGHIVSHKGDASEYLVKMDLGPTRFRVANVPPIHHQNLQRNAPFATEKPSES